MHVASDEEDKWKRVHGVSTSFNTTAHESEQMKSFAGFFYLAVYEEGNTDEEEMQKILTERDSGSPPLVPATKGSTR